MVTKLVLVDEAHHLLRHLSPESCTIVFSEVCAALGGDTRSTLAFGADAEKVPGLIKADVGTSSSLALDSTAEPDVSSIEVASDRSFSSLGNSLEDVKYHISVAVQTVDEGTLEPHS